MKLTTNEPPGRITRKAREFEADIAQLHAQGYTLAAIARSLAAAGVQVSISTVRREVRRHAGPVLFTSNTPQGYNPAVAQPAQLATVPAVPTAAPATAAAPATPAAVLFIPGQPDPPSAKDLAEAFARSKNVNPFARTKEQP